MERLVIPGKKNWGRLSVIPWADIPTSREGISKNLHVSKTAKGKADVGK